MCPRRGNIGVFVVSDDRRSAAREKNIRAVVAAEIWWGFLRVRYEWENLLAKIQEQQLRNQTIIIINVLRSQNADKPRELTLRSLPQCLPSHPSTSETASWSKSRTLTGWEELRDTQWKRERPVRGWEGFNQRSSLGGCSKREKLSLKNLVSDDSASN